MNKGMTAVRASEVKGRKAVCISGNEAGRTDLAQELASLAVVAVEVRLGSETVRAGTILRDIAGRTAAYRGNSFTILFFPEWDKVSVGPFLARRLYVRQFVDLEPLV